MPDYALMNQYLYEGKAKEVEQMTKDALAEGRHFQEVMNEGLIAGMSVVGEDFKHNVLYVPEVLIAARAMKAGMAVLKPLLSARENDANRVGVLLMGTVRGDLHDIGKNLVCMMAEGAGFEVYDIGVDQSVEKFMAAADRVNPKIIGMSALLTTTMTYMKTVIDGFQVAGRGEIKMAIGGAPISQMFADEIGADGYGQNASAAVDLFLRLAGAKQDEPKTKSSNVVPIEAGNLLSPTALGRRSTYKVLYWQEVPSQVRAEDDAGNDVSVELPPKFAQRIDLLAQKRGITGADAYTAEWKWSDEQERDGSAHDVVAAVIAELEAKANW
jgi:5-methyltetrahydrofolate--homocysteine methyltransferase